MIEPADGKELEHDRLPHTHTHLRLPGTPKRTRRSQRAPRRLIVSDWAESVSQLEEEQAVFQRISCLIEQLRHRTPTRISRSGKPISGVFADPDGGAHELSTTRQLTDLSMPREPRNWS